MQCNKNFLRQNVQKSVCFPRWDFLGTACEVNSYSTSFLNVFVSISCTRHDLLFFRDRIYIIWGLSLRSPLFLYSPKEGHSTKSVPRPACWKACLFSQWSPNSYRMTFSFASHFCLLFFFHGPSCFVPHFMFVFTFTSHSERKTLWEPNKFGSFLNWKVAGKEQEWMILVICLKIYPPPPYPILQDTFL